MVGEPDLGQTIPSARRGKHPQLRRTGFGTRQDEDDNQEEEDEAEQTGRSWKGFTLNLKRCLVSVTVQIALKKILELP